MRWWWFSILLVACGPKPLTPTPDGPDEPDGPPPDVQVSGCDYSELRDTTNDDVPPATGTPEDTGQTFAQELVVCGSFAADHFDGDITVDVDGYLITLASAADVLVRIHGAGAETIELVGLDVYTGPAFDQLVGSNTFYGDHGVAAMHLPAGTYELAAFALATAAISSAVDYRITITADAPDTRCAAVTTGGFAEANDGANSTGNDVITIPSGAPPALTASNADAPEPSGLTIAAGVSTRVTGSLADVAVADQYEDKDTFLIASGDANELAVRLDWTTATNLDYLVFEEGSAEAVTRAIAPSTTGPEYETFAVKPNTSYWLLVGAKVGGALPATYSATLCGASFAP